MHSRLIRSKIRNKYENTYKYRHLFQFKDSFILHPFEFIAHSRMQEVAYVFSLLYGPTDKSGADFEYRRRNCPTFCGKKVASTG